MVKNNIKKVRDDVDTIDVPSVDVDKLTNLDEYRESCLVPIDGETNLWDRMEDKGETSYFYYMFCLYLMLPPVIRSYTKVAEIILKQTGKDLAPNSIRSTGLRFNWQTRSAAYDDYLSSCKLEENEDAVKRMNRYYGQVARKLVDAYMIPHQAIIQKLQDGSVLDEMLEYPTLKLLTVLNKFTDNIIQLNKMERLSMGVATEHTATVTAHHGSVNVELQGFADKMAAVEEKLAEKKQLTEGNKE